MCKLWKFCYVFRFRGSFILQIYMVTKVIQTCGDRILTHCPCLVMEMIRIKLITELFLLVAKFNHQKAAYCYSQPFIRVVTFVYLVTVSMILTIRSVPCFAA